jgi:hypothetical protein
VEAREQTFATRLEEQLKAALEDKAALEAELMGGEAGAVGGKVCVCGWVCGCEYNGVLSVFSLCHCPPRPLPCL